MLSARSLAAVSAVVGLFLAACTSGGSATSPPADQGEASAGGGQGAVVATRDDSELGTILVDADGRTLYLFEKDESAESTCYDECASVWPPYTTDGDPQAQGDADGSMLGQTQRDSGEAQVTYNDHPLYYYEPDSGESTMGQGLDQFGAEWYVLSPQGDKVEEEGEEGEGS